MSQLIYENVRMKRISTLNLTVLSSLICITSMGQPQTNVESTLEIVNIKSGKRKVILQEKSHFEAPNWSRDGSYFIINSGGKLYKVDRDGKNKELINTGSATSCNNDHGISPDGSQLVISNSIEASPGNYSSAIFILPTKGGEPKLITENTPSYWHGWSPDGKTLAFVGMRNDEFDIYTIPVTGGVEKQITFSKGLDDGPEYSPDGKYIYYNSFQTGRMQIWRINAGGGTPEQLTFDEYANWFPHPSPDGKYIVYISYMEDQKENHPFGKDVRLRLMNLKTGKIRDMTAVFWGGQGTINVPSWSPDSRMVAFISYRSLK
jgi:Tol biopolymer transport system component